MPGEGCFEPPPAQTANVSVRSRAELRRSLPRRVLEVSSLAWRSWSQDSGPSQMALARGRLAPRQEL
eukprot:1124582-Pyramimonas_sp.AAC.1